ncbi:MAG: hypothetical protein ACLVKA_06640 [Collinsella aerofaciens]
MVATERGWPDRFSQSWANATVPLIAQRTIGYFDHTDKRIAEATVAERMHFRVVNLCDRAGDWRRVFDAAHAKLDGWRIAKAVFTDDMERLGVKTRPVHILVSKESGARNRDDIVCHRSAELPPVRLFA